MAVSTLGMWTTVMVGTNELQDHLVVVSRVTARE
jgi:hypothetical protein